MMSQWDKDNIEAIIHGHGDWFGAKLLRLIVKADSMNIEKLRLGFPEEVKIVEAWRRGE